MGEEEVRIKGHGWGWRKEALRLTLSWEEEQTEGPNSDLSFGHTEF